MEEHLFYGKFVIVFDAGAKGEMFFRHLQNGASFRNNLVTETFK